MGVRLPTILGKAIDDVWKTLNQESEEERITDLVECVHRMEDLMSDLQENAKLRPIIDDGAGDVALWNKEIAKYFKGKDFMNAPWLFAEAYKYRRLRESFSLSKYWVDYGELSHLILAWLIIHRRFLPPEVRHFLPILSSCV